jgi:hypothetical protein
MEPKSVTPETHKEFYQFTSNSFDEPRFTLHFRTDVPLSVQALLYFPEGKPGLFLLNLYDFILLYYLGEGVVVAELAKAYVWCSDFWGSIPLPMGTFISK